MKNRRRHSAETKTKAVLEALKEDQTLAEVAAKYEVPPKLLAQWKQEFLENAITVFNRKKKEKDIEADLKEKDKVIEELYKEVGQLTLERIWIKKKLETLDSELKQEMVCESDKLSVFQQCQVLGISRSSYYYKPRPQSLDQGLKRALFEIYEEYPFYGYRKVIHALKEKGFEVGTKLIRRLKRELGLKTFYPEPKTSIPNKAHKKYPYLLKGIEIERPGQVWSTDISYLPIGRGHVYLVGIIDWYSRKILSYRISNTMDRHFCMEALDEALQKYGKPEIFNTDQGSQFTSADFTGRLEAEGIAISMDGKGRCLDNIFIERWFRSLKYEDLYLKDYQNVLELQVGIKHYVQFYNQRRYHQALNYKTPDQIFYADTNTFSGQGVNVA